MPIKKNFYQTYAKDIKICHGYAKHFKFSSFAQVMPEILTFAKFFWFCRNYAKDFNFYSTYAKVFHLSPNYAKTI
jgi:hypothetical protein